MTIVIIVLGIYHSSFLKKNITSRIDLVREKRIVLPGISFFLQKKNRYFGICSWYEWFISIRVLVQRYSPSNKNDNKRNTNTFQSRSKQHIFQGNTVTQLFYEFQNNEIKLDLRRTLDLDQDVIFDNKEFKQDTVILIKHSHFFPFLKERALSVKIGRKKSLKFVCPSQSDLSFRKICICNE